MPAISASQITMPSSMILRLSGGGPCSSGIRYIVKHLHGTGPVPVAEGLAVTLAHAPAAMRAGVLGGVAGGDLVDRRLQLGAGPLPQRPQRGDVPAQEIDALDPRLAHDQRDPQLRIVGADHVG